MSETIGSHSRGLEDRSRRAFVGTPGARLLGLLALSCSLLPASVAWADEAEESEVAPVATETDVLLVEDSLPYVPSSNTIATKLPVELAWTPANVGVVDSLLLEEQGALVLGDALGNVSGMNVQTGNGVFDYFVVRGFDSLSSGLILTDGAPEPEVTFYQLYNAERVEVLKGPGGFLYGPNPLAGAVNIVRKQPLPADFAVVGVTGGSHGTLEGTVDLNLGSSEGRASFRLNGLYRESDGYRDGLESEVTAINPAFSWRPSEATTINVNTELLSSDFIPDAGLPLLFGELAPVDRDRSYGSPFDTSEQDLQRVQIDVDHEISDRVSIRNKTYYRELDWLSSGTLLNGAFPTQTGDVSVFRTLVTLDDRQRVFGNQLEALYRVETGSVVHNLVFGLELSLLQDEYTLDVFALPSISLFSPTETATRPLFPIPGQAAAGDSETTIVAPYVIDQMVLNERWQVLLGARFDEIEFEDEVSGTERGDGEASPMLGVVFAPVDGLSFYASAGQSFAPPSVRVVGERQPEESTQFEIGARRELAGGRVRTTLALFQLERDNIAIPDDNGFTQQAGDQRARGVELEVAADLGAGLTAFGSYAYTDSELTRFTELVLVNPFTGQFATLDRSGNASAFAPEHLASVWLSKRWGSGFQLGGGGRYIGEQFIAEDNVVELDGHFIANASVGYRLGDWRLDLRLENLFDEEYETRGFGSTSVIPGRPFGATLGVQYRFGS